MRRPFADTLLLALLLALTPLAARAQAQTSKPSAPPPSGNTVMENAMMKTLPTGSPEFVKLAESDRAPELTPVVPRDRATRRLLEGFSTDAAIDRELIEVSDLLDVFGAEAHEFSAEVNTLVHKRYGERRTRMIDSYERAITDIEIFERQERRDAIAVFEDFLKRYPDDPRFTPDAMFRLAELYYEKTNDDYQMEMARFEEQYRLAEEGKLSAFPREPRENYQPSIALYQQLITTFPAYALNDASHYLLGYCLEKQGEFTESRDAFNRLIAKYPISRFVPEAWIRIGEYYFDAVNEPNALRLSAEAYTKAIAFPDHPLFDKALYKLGWVYYRLDDFDNAVETFVKLLDHYAARQAAADDGETMDGGDLKNEALQYMAISFADDRWGSIDRAEALFQRLGERPWEAEFWRRLGDVQSDQTRWNEAIAAYRKNLDKAPLDPLAPSIHSKIVKAYETGLREFDKAFDERDRLVARYAPGSAWFEANKADSKVLKDAEALAEQILYNSALHHHRQATEYASAGNVERARQAFEIAARTYTRYLTRFPHSKEAYELTFYLADCQYQSLDFDAAAQTYAKVRDFSGEKRYQAEAAFGVVLARQRDLEIRQSGSEPEVPPPVLFTARDWPEGRLVEKRELHPLHLEFVQAIDEFIALVPKHDRAPQSAYRAAELFYVAQDFEEARRRFSELVSTYPDSEFASFASNLTLETFLITQDWVAVTAFTDALTSPDDKGRVRVDPNSENGRLLRDFGDNAMFKRAEQLMAAEEWDEAGELFEKLVARNIIYRFADKALNNAALCREKGHRFDSALRLYERIYREYPDSDLADLSLFRVAYNAENSYDFDKAVQRYQLLVEKYPNSTRREAALNNVAVLLEALQNYSASAKQFIRFAQLFPKSELAPRNLYKAARVYQKMGDCRRQNQVLDDFIDRFSRDKAQGPLIVQAHKEIGDCWMKLGSTKNALRAYEETTREFERRALDASAPQAAEAAGEARFRLAEAEFAKWDALEITGRSKALEKSFLAKLNAAKALQQSYVDVMRFKSAEWILAASYKRGYVYERFATSLVESPCPPDIKRAYGEEGCEMYRSTLVDKVSGLETSAAEFYEQTAEQCLKFGLIEVPWCDRAQDSLSRLRSDVLVLKKARSLTRSATLYPASFQTLDGKQSPVLPVALRPNRPEPPAPLAPPPTSDLGDVDTGAGTSAGPDDAATTP
ncbi:MAG: tetratricopeptide repeat protein, partial [Myxococcales bacterium]|nr:tetratricopeptide repeat protein [Myxococcales bacterium]